jgi:hypothetical protein
MAGLQVVVQPIIELIHTNTPYFIKVISFISIYHRFKQHHSYSLLILFSKDLLLVVANFTLYLQPLVATCINEYVYCNDT